MAYRTVSFDGIVDAPTFLASGITYGTDEGKPFKVSGNKTAALAAADDLLDGIIETISEDSDVIVGRIRGFVTVAYSGSAPSAGIQKLEADGAGGVRVDADNGREYLVVDVDTTNTTVTFLIA
jgi:hypothetical protein